LLPLGEQVEPRIRPVKQIEAARPQVGERRHAPKPLDGAPVHTLARRKMRSKELAEVKGMRFDTLDRICAALDCQPGDILEYQPKVESAKLPIKARA